jgi:hypothetical protein
VRLMPTSRSSEKAKPLLVSRLHLNIVKSTKVTPCQQELRVHVPRAADAKSHWFRYGVQHFALFQNSNESHSINYSVIHHPITGRENSSQQCETLSRFVQR